MCLATDKNKKNFINQNSEIMFVSFLMQQKKLIWEKQSVITFTWIVVAYLFIYSLSLKQNSHTLPENIFFSPYNDLDLQ